VRHVFWSDSTAVVLHRDAQDFADIDGVPRQRGRPRSRSYRFPSPL
jgi:hypothetical protein